MPGLDLGSTQAIRHFHDLFVSPVEFRVAEETKQFNSRQLAPLLAYVPHLQYGENQAADDDHCAENFGHVGQS